MEVDHENEDESEYRVKIGNHVKYLKIVPGTFDSDTLSFPLGFLPTIPYEGNWTMARVHRDIQSGELKTGFSDHALAGVRNIWHDTLVSVLDLQRTNQLTGATFEATHSSEVSGVPPGKILIAKIARFEWEIPRIENETKAYQLLEGLGVAPRFLAHIHEEGRVMGFLLEKVDGRSASIQDLEACQAVLQKFHGLGLVHGDVNRYNFLITKDGVKLIDFERIVERVGADAQAKELSGLEAELTDESGRGAGFVFSGEDN